MSKPLFFVTPNTPVGRACIWTDRANPKRKAQIKALTPLAEKGNIMAQQALVFVTMTDIVAGAV